MLTVSDHLAGQGKEPPQIADHWPGANTLRRSAWLTPGCRRQGLALTSMCCGPADG
jgi:hypothetical protein